MNPVVNFPLDEKRVRFTDGGKLYVLDAISALSEIDRADTIWNDLKTEKPQINQYIEYHRLSEGIRVPITDSAGWAEIQILIFDYLLNRVSP